MSPKASRREREARALDRATAREVLEELARDRSQSVRAAVAMNPSTPPVLLLALVDDTSAWVSHSAVHNLSADRPVWKRALARGGGLLLDVAQVPWLPLDLAEELARHADRQVRVSVAQSTVWRQLVTVLSYDPDVEVRAAVARSRVADLDLWVRLSTDPLKKVRASLALNRRTPTHLLAGLAHDRSADVRWSVVASRPDEPELMGLFVDDPDELVRDHARLHLAHPATRTFHDDGSLSFSYPQTPDFGTNGLVFPTDPIGDELIRQLTERETKRKSFLT